MEFTDLTTWLKQRLAEPLPGRQAQLKMSSLKRIRELMKDKVPASAQKSGVLILLYPSDHDIKFALMRRPDYAGVHGGQISLPGGKFEQSDKDLTATALREANEEIGVDISLVRILGHLTELYIPPSNFQVLPVVGFQNTKPYFIADPDEVADIIEIGLEDFLDDKNIRMKDARISLGFTIKVPSFYIDGNMIWGATAMILSELREIIAEFRSINK